MPTLFANSNNKRIFAPLLAKTAIDGAYSSVG
jgi:hypothetical protein